MHEKLSIDTIKQWAGRAVEQGQVNRKLVPQLKPLGRPAADGSWRGKQKRTRREAFEAFWIRVDMRGEDECWPYCGAPNSPPTHRHTMVDGKYEKSYRVAWMSVNGDIPDGYCVCHHCDNPICCNPKHLFCGTKRDNALDMCAKGRHVGKRTLNADQVRELRRLRTEGKLDVDTLAEKYKTSRNNIWAVARGKNWKHVK